MCENLGASAESSVCSALNASAAKAPVPCDAAEDVPLSEAPKPGIVEYRGVRLDLSHPLFTDRLRRAVERGWYEGSEAHAVAEMVQSGDTVAEFGGGCGFLSAFMAKTADNLRIHCVEANPQLLPLIAHHHELNGVAGIELYNEVVGRADGTASFYLHKDFWASSMTPDPAGERVEIPCRRLLSRLEEWRPDVVVMDIEGAELDLLVEPLPRWSGRSSSSCTRTSTVFRA